MLAMLLGLSLPACGRSEAAQEADRVARAVDVVRDAPNDPVDARRDLLAKLAAEQAKDATAIAARDACVAAYTPFLEGQTLEAMLEQAKLKMPECDRSLHDLKHKHR
jgi:hypothetical protein